MPREYVTLPITARMNIGSETPVTEQRENCGREGVNRKTGRQRTGPVLPCLTPYKGVKNDCTMYNPLEMG